ncbi:hypothetical protein ACFL2T_04285 [Elusimicrobiota bacterium]
MRIHPLAAVSFVLALAGTSVVARERIKVQRYLESLLLGDKIEQIEMVYPPKKKWKRERERRSKLERVVLSPQTAKYFPSKGREFHLRMRHKRLVWIQVIYNKEESRRKPLEELVVDLSLVYGEPRRIEKSDYDGTQRGGLMYCWWDRDTALVVSNVELLRERGETPEMRTSLELMGRSYFSEIR